MAKWPDGPLERADARGADPKLPSCGSWQSSGSIAAQAAYAGCSAHLACLLVINRPLFTRLDKPKHKQSINIL